MLFGRQTALDRIGQIAQRRRTAVQLQQNAGTRPQGQSQMFATVRLQIETYDNDGGGICYYNCICSYLTRPA